MARRRKEPRQDNLVRHPRVSPAPPAPPPSPCPLPTAPCPPSFASQDIHMRVCASNSQRSTGLSFIIHQGQLHRGLWRSWGGGAREGGRRGGGGDGVEGKFTHSAMPKWRLATSRSLPSTPECDEGGLQDANFIFIL